MLNHDKRKTLKAISGVSAGLISLGLAPKILAASQILNQNSIEDNPALSITHTETVFGRTFFIQNISDQAIKLETVVPGRIATSSGEFDINTLLVNGPLEIQPGTTQAHSISADGRIQNKATWKTVESNSKVLATKGRVQPVKINVHDQAHLSAPKPSVHIGYFA